MSVLITIKIQADTDKVRQAFTHHWQVEPPREAGRR